MTLKHNFIFLSPTTFPFLLLWLFHSSVSFAAEIEPDYLLDLEIEDLLAIEVTSVSKYGQLLQDAPAAITVIDDEMIKDSGLLEIPEILRLAPGMQVVRADTGSWYASARSPLIDSQKLLVLSDGRSIFSDDVGYVLWPAQSFFLEDIDRIEVIRGPGGTTWGYNAINGIVNIITKRVSQSQGFFADSAMGNDGLLMVQARYGGKISDDIFFKVYGGTSQYDQFSSPNTELTTGKLTKNNGGFRLDFEPSNNRFLTMEGGITNSDDDITVGYKDEYSTKYLSGKWLETISDNFDLELISYYDDATHTFVTGDLGKAFAIDMQSFTTELHLDWRTSQRNRLTMGGGLKFSTFSPENGFQITFAEDEENWGLYNLFLSDEFAVMPGKLWLTTGVKMEHNSETGEGWQPNIRLLYKAAPTHSIWAAISQALRMPDFEDSARRIITDFLIDPETEQPLWYRYTFLGEPLEDEKVTAYELGYRARFFQDFSSDIAFFYHQNENLLVSEFALTPRTNQLIVINNYDNSSNVYGTELALSYQPDSTWYLAGSYTYLYSENDIFYLFETERVKVHRFQVHAHYEPTGNINLDSHLYWNNGYTIGISEIPEHLRLDIGITYRFSDGVDLSLTGQNLLEEHHTEIIDDSYSSYHTEVPRRVFLRLRLNL